MDKMMMFLFLLRHDLGAQKRSASRGIRKSETTT